LKVFDETEKLIDDLIKGIRDNTFSFSTINDNIAKLEVYRNTTGVPTA